MLDFRWFVIVLIDRGLQAFERSAVSLIFRFNGANGGEAEKVCFGVSRVIIIGKRQFKGEKYPGVLITHRRVEE
jgi:hypothetical protein